jgi:hypothetical protein
LPRKSDREKLYHELLKRVARELNQPPDTEIVKHVATFRLLRESLQVRLLDGERVDPDDLFKCDEVLKAYLPQGKPLAVQIEFVPSTDDAKPDEAAVDGVKQCRRCGWKPADKDRVSKCYRCGWYHGADSTHLPWTSISDVPKPVEQPSVKAEEPENIAQTSHPSGAIESCVSELPKPIERQSPKWSGTGDNAFMPAVDHTRGNEDLIKRSPWHNSAALLGVIRGNGKLPGDPDRR